MIAVLILAAGATTGPIEAVAQSATRVACGSFLETGRGPQSLRSALRGFRLKAFPGQEPSTQSEQSPPARRARRISPPFAQPQQNKPQTSRLEPVPEGPPGASQPPPATYQLSPQQRARAIAYSHARYWLYFLGVALSLVIYWFLWLSRYGVFLRGRARKLSPRHFLQCLFFVPCFLVAASLLELPFDFLSDFVLDRRFGLSAQSWMSWLADWSKTLGLSVVAGVFVVWIFYITVRRRPRSWWFYFWLVTIPVTLFVIFIEPYVVEPLYYKFTPLERSQPALVEKIEDMLHHAGLSIPPSRIFLMDASSKTRELNAYVSGFGSSQRVVVWDTTLEGLAPDEVLAVLGHETGHYVLHHIVKEFGWIELITLVFLAFGFWLVKVLIRRYGAETGVEGEGDLASLPIMLLVLTLLTFLSSPAVNAVSRHYEHQADQFGLEVTCGVVQNPNAAMVAAFQKLGAVDLSDPAPNPFIEFWLYSHPPLDQRIRFAAAYKPWAEGKPMRLLPSPKR